jgi:hypothetical protein
MITLTSTTSLDLSLLQDDILNLAEIDRKSLRESLRSALSWLSEHAQVLDEAEGIEKRHHQLSWKGAIKGEYSVASKKWSFFCPVWHTGQAIKAFVLGYQALDEQHWLEKARLAADFIHANSIDGEEKDEKIILAYEDYDDKLNTSAILECLDGLRYLYECQGKSKDRKLFLDATQWIMQHAWRQGEGLLQDFYDPKEKKFFDRQGYSAQRGRPLLDDGIFLTAFQLSGNTRFREVFYDIAARLLKDENPSGNWINYPPCRVESALIHPRHAYWWGFPMFMAFQDSGEEKYLDCALRACRWYVKAQRRDGGLFRSTYQDFNTDSFGHATSGIASAMSMFLEATQVTGSQEFIPALAKALVYCMKMQFRNVSDNNLQGAILEKVLPPGGTDQNPYHIRDLGTIFYAQAAAKILALGDEKELF